MSKIIVSCFHHFSSFNYLINSTDKSYQFLIFTCTNFLVSQSLFVLILRTDINFSINKANIYGKIHKRYIHYIDISLTKDSFRQITSLTVFNLLQFKAGSNTFSVLFTIISVDLKSVSYTHLTLPTILLV